MKGGPLSIVSGRALLLAPALTAGSSVEKEGSCMSSKSAAEGVGLGLGLSVAVETIQ